MVGGKRWTDEENELLLGLIAEGLSFQEIFDSGKFPDRTCVSVELQAQRLGASSSDKPNQTMTVQEIEPSKDNLTMEEVVKLFSSAFKQICASKEVNKYTLERFRIIFQASRDYGPLLAHFEKWDEIEKRINELSAAVQALQPAKVDAKLPS